MLFSQQQQKKIFFIFRFFWLTALFELDLTYVCACYKLVQLFTLSVVVVVVVFFLSTNKLIFPVFPIKHLMYGSKVVLFLLFLHSFTMWCSGVAVLFLCQLFVMVIFSEGKFGSMFYNFII